MIRQKKKLSLGAESIRVLSDTALGRVNGGAGKCTAEQSGCGTGTSGSMCVTGCLPAPVLLVTRRRAAHPERTRTIARCPRAWS